MRLNRQILLITILGLLSKTLLAQSYVLTDFPVSLMVPDTTVTIKWAGINRDITSSLPDSGRIYYSTSPGGAILENYPDSIYKRVIDTTDTVGLNIISHIVYNIPDTTSSPQQRMTQFIPEENGMTPGKYYFVVAFRTKIFTGIDSVDTVFISNEIPIIIETPTAVELTTPATGAEIEELTPTFAWKPNPGVPYYHIMVSDEQIDLDLDSGSIAGLSIVWEAITANNQIVYGSSDPSGNLTADPPPMSPGLDYSWVVLNNYGNHPAYTSTKFGIPANFSIAGEGLDIPVNLSPLNDTTLTSLLASEIELTWTNYDTTITGIDTVLTPYLDSNVNTYKIYVYVNADIDSNIDAKTVVWSTEVTAGQFTGDTASVKFNAASILTDNTYSWKVIAIDAKGAGTSGNISKFSYSTPSGTMIIRTKENITSGGATVEKDIGLVELKLEVLDGANDAPLLFYTDNNGYFERKRQAGSYRVTAIKEGFNSKSKTITVVDDVNSPDPVTFYLERPDATIFGKVLDDAGLPVNIAELVAISERGDTVYGETDPSGNYTLSCYGADWSIMAKKEGYISSDVIDTAVSSGSSIDLGSRLIITKNPYTLSGLVKNSSGSAILGAKVELLLEGVVIDQIPSTPQSGAYSFTVENGTYILSAEKVGFSSYIDTVVVLSSMQKNITMTAGASLISGYVIGRSYSTTGQEIYGPVKNATVKIIDTSSTGGDTVTATTDGVYGSYSKSIVGGGKRYLIQASKQGYEIGGTYTDTLIENGKTYTNVNDTIFSLASFVGRISYSSELSGVSVNLINLASSEIAASGQSDITGEFEVRNIANSGDYLKLSAGLEGYIVDSIVIHTSVPSITSDSIIISNGRVLAARNGEPVDSVVIYLESGDKYLSWYLSDGDSLITNALIKVKAPILKTVNADDSLKGIGPDNYIVTIDPDADSLIDLSYHTYTIPDGVDSVFVDSIILSAVHNLNDTISVDSLGMVSLSMTLLGDTADSGYIYYRDASAPAFKSAVLIKGVTDSINSKTSYSAELSDVKDGSLLVYYFRLFRGTDKYGHDQEVYRVYVKPNNKVVSRVAIIPSTEDTLIVAADDELDFTFSAYYGSKYKEVDSLSDANVRWAFSSTGGFGCTIEGSGQSILIKTAKNGTGNSVVVLNATFVAAGGYNLAASVDSVATIAFKVLPYKIDSIAVIRTNEDGRGYVTNSTSERAEFMAIGIIKNGDSSVTEVNVTPAWRIIPANAGTMTSGVFKPSSKYLGRVDVYADAGRKDGYYYQQDGRGLPVRFIIPVAGDTATNGLGYLQNNEGCKIIFPAGEVNPGSQIEISLEVENPNNLVFLSSTLVEDSTDADKLTGKFDLVGSVYDINVAKGILDTTNDVVDTVVLGVPLNYQEEVKAGNQFYVAHWDNNENEWVPIESTSVSADGGLLYAPVNHFSRYAILSKPRKTNADFNIYPNPFSPYVKPKARDGLLAQFGTCFTINPVSKDFSTLNIQIDIFNMVGDRVWSTMLQNAVSSKEYKIWWDGKTIKNTRALGGDNLVANEEDGVYSIEGDRMCRNGRYIAVLTIEDQDTKKQYTKNLVLFK